MRRNGGKTKMWRQRRKRKNKMLRRRQSRRGNKKDVGRIRSDERVRKGTREKEKKA